MLRRYLFLPIVFFLTAIIAWWASVVQPEQMAQNRSSLDLPEIMLPLTVNEAKADTLQREPASHLPELEIVPLSQ